MIMANTDLTENSVITRTRRKKFALASSDAEHPLDPITHIAFGSGGVGGDGEPLPPSEEQTALNAELFRVPVDSITYPEETTVLYAVTIPADEHTGDAISEAALVDTNGDLAAIKNFYAKRKDAGTAFTFEFDDKF